MPNTEDREGIKNCLTGLALLPLVILAVLAKAARRWAKC